VRVVATRVRPVREGVDTARFVSGWGASIEEASIGCRREAAERYAAQFAGDEPVERGEIRRFAGAAVAPSEILLIGDEQFARRRLPLAGEADMDWPCSCAISTRCSTRHKRRQPDNAKISLGGGPIFRNRKPRRCQGLHDTDVRPTYGDL
jgi:hypothetical protein